MSRRRHGLDHISTSTLRATLVGLCASGLGRVFFARLAEDIRAELLARDLPRIADETGGYACAGVEGVQ